jgi:hypothetical protein
MCGYCVDVDYMFVYTVHVSVYKKRPIRLIHSTSLDGLISSASIFLVLPFVVLLTQAAEFSELIAHRRIQLAHKMGKLSCQIIY